MKAAGLAGGKGVIVTSNRQEAAQAVDLLTTHYADAASTLVVEERLHGEEISASVFHKHYNRIQPIDIEIQLHIRYFIFVVQHMVDRLAEKSNNIRDNEQELVLKIFLRY